MHGNGVGDIDAQEWSGEGGITMILELSHPKSGAVQITPAQIWMILKLFAPKISLMIFFFSFSQFCIRYFKN